MSGELPIAEGTMLTVYFAEVQLQAHQHTLERALARRSQLRAVQAMQVQARVPRWTVPSHVLIALSTQLIGETGSNRRRHPQRRPNAAMSRTQWVDTNNGGGR